MRWKWAVSIGALFAAIIAVVASLGMPAIFAEAFIFSLHHEVAVLPRPADPQAFDPRPGPPLGKVVAGYWRVQQIAPATFAIGEPQNDPDNYEYLIVGSKRALLVDSGATARNIHAVLAILTSLPVTAIPTHLHWDHTNGLRSFTAIALVDLPETRGRVRGDGYVQLSRHEYIDNDPPRFRVTEWIKPDGVVDLGGRRVRILSTPGHTATSISVYDPANRFLFTGDFLYPTSLYAFMPDSSLSAYAATADRLLAALPGDTRLYGAHCCRNDVPAQAPWLGLDDLRDARAEIGKIQAGTATGGRGLFIRRYPVNSRMTILTLYPFGNR